MIVVHGAVIVLIAAHVGMMKAYFGNMIMRKNCLRKIKLKDYNITDYKGFKSTRKVKKIVHRNIKRSAKQNLDIYEC